MCDHRNYNTIGYNRHTDRYLNQCIDCDEMFYGQPMRFYEP